MFIRVTNALNGERVNANLLASTYAGGTWNGGVRFESNGAYRVKLSSQGVVMRDVYVVVGDAACKSDGACEDQTKVCDNRTNRCLDRLASTAGEGGSSDLLGSIPYILAAVIAIMVLCLGAYCLCCACVLFAKNKNRPMPRSSYEMRQMRRHR